MRTKPKRESALRIDDLITIEPITKAQSKVFNAWKKEENNLVLNGCAGTGKTFIALYLALEAVMNKSTPWESVILVRSVVPTREMGFLPGTEEEKTEPYTSPYRAICAELFEVGNAFDKLVEKDILLFESTSYIRGQTFNNSIIVVDEMQNLNFHELDSVITRVGENTKIIFCGDYYQSDFKNDKDKQGINRFIKILEVMKSFSIVEFGVVDVCRSGLVRDYIISKNMLEKDDEL